MVNALKINRQDNVVVALSDLPAGIRLEWAEAERNGHIATESTVPFGHKVAIAPIREGEVVIKYGASIGIATDDISPGQHVHTHNLASVRGAAQS